MIESLKVRKTLKKDSFKLLSKNAEMLLFLMYSLRAIAYVTSFPLIPERFVAPNFKEYDGDIDTETNSNYSDDV